MHKTDKLSLNKEALRRILAAYLQYKNFTAYYKQFNHIDAMLYCLYGRLKSPLHFYFCKNSLARKLASKLTSEAIS